MSTLTSFIESSATSEISATSESSATSQNAFFYTTFFSSNMCNRCTYKNSHVKVQLISPHRLLNDDDDSDSPSESKYYLPDEEEGIVSIRWKNLHTGDEKLYKIQTGNGLMLPLDPALICEHMPWMSVSPRGKYIMLWYGTLMSDYTNKILRVIVIDTETQESMTGTREDFGEYIDIVPKKNYYHPYCLMHVYDNGLVHVTNSVESFENYLFDLKTKTIVYNFAPEIEEVVDYCYDFDGSFSTATDLIICSSFYNSGNQKRVPKPNTVFVYNYETKELKNVTMTTQQLLDVMKESNGE